MKCTHVAFQVRDIDKSIAFYERHCGMCVVHHRQENDTPVAWMGWGEDPPKFVLVLIAGEYEKNVQPPWQHIGMAVDTHDDVDRIHEKAQADGITGLWSPVEAGPVVGYFCGVPDPDGNVVEFSFGQRLG